MTKTARDPESIHPPLAGYSHQIELSGDERLLVMSGQEEQREVLATTLGGHRPCMTLIGVAGLATPAYKVELDAWASKGG